VAELIRRHPLVIFFSLAFAITWVVWVPRTVGAQLGLVGLLIGRSWEVSAPQALRSGAALVSLPLFLMILTLTDGQASGSSEGEDAVCPRLSVAAIRHQGEAKYKRLGGFSRRFVAETHPSPQVQHPAGARWLYEARPSQDSARPSC